MSGTTGQPLNSDEQIKLVVFALLFIPSVIFGAGIIPTLFLIFGIYMMKKNSDFNHIKTAVKYFRIYMNLAFLGAVVTAVIFGYRYFTIY